MYIQMLLFKYKMKWPVAVHNLFTWNWMIFKLLIFYIVDLKTKLEEFVTDQTINMYDENSVKGLQRLKNGDINIDDVVSKWHKAFTEVNIVVVFWPTKRMLTHFFVFYKTGCLLFKLYIFALHELCKSPCVTYQILIDL